MIPRDNGYAGERSKEHSQTQAISKEALKDIVHESFGKHSGSSHIEKHSGAGNSHSHVEFTNPYEVHKGDNLWKIAKKAYGEGHRWKDIYEANKDRLKDPNKIYAGEKLNIPKLELHEKKHAGHPQAEGNGKPKAGTGEQGAADAAANASKQGDKQREDAGSGLGKAGAGAHGAGTPDTTADATKQGNKQGQDAGSGPGKAGAGVHGAGPSDGTTDATKQGDKQRQGAGSGQLKDEAADSQNSPRKGAHANDGNGTGVGKDGSSEASANAPDKTNDASNVAAHAIAQQAVRDMSGQTMANQAQAFDKALGQYRAMAPNGDAATFVHQLNQALANSQTKDLWAAYTSDGTIGLYRQYTPPFASQPTTVPLRETKLSNVQPNQTTGFWSRVGDVMGEAALSGWGGY